MDPMPGERRAMAERFRAVMDLAEFAERVMQQNLRRRNPAASEDEIERLLLAWLRVRPGAEGGDAEGRSVRWPRGR